MKLWDEIRYNWRYWLTPPRRYLVITGVPKESEGRDGGNLYDEIVEPPRIRILAFTDGTRYDSGSGDAYYSCEPPPPQPCPIKMVCVELPVFRLGELLVVNRSEREICGGGRKPSKWGVDYEIFWTLRRALRRSKEAVNANL